MSFNPDFIDTRAERRLAELLRHLYPFRRPIRWVLSDGWPQHLERPDAIDDLVRLDKSPNASQSLPSGPTVLVELPEADCRITWLHADISIPEELDGRRAALLLETNGEAMVFVDGEIRQGLDENRPEVLLAEQGTAGKGRRIDVMLFSGRDRRRKTFKGEIVTVAEDVAEYRHALRVALGVVRTLPAENTTTIRIWKGMIRSMDALDFHTRYGSVDVSEARDVLDEQVFGLISEGHPPADIDIYMTGNSHIDIAWLWTFAETRQKMARTTATALQYMRELPDYTFGQSQAQLYEWLRQDHPSLFRQVQKRVQEGRWEILGAAWVEPDCNISGGEALVRQVLYGNKFWEEHFGRVIDVMWLPDTFGYSWALPQILKQCGIDTFVTQKLTWSESNQFPHGLFDWEGPDGSRVRCIFPQDYNARTFPEDIIRWYEHYPSKHVVPALLYPYGFGDGGGGPVAEDVAMARLLSEAPGFPRCHLTTGRTGIHEINSRANEWAQRYRSEIPVWRGELYLEFHRGTLTTHARIKRFNRMCEVALREAELWASLASIHGAENPADDLETAWKKVLLNQFHDVVPGTSIPPVYDDAVQLYEEVLETCRRISEEARQWFVTDERPLTYVVFNSLGWEVTDWVELDVPAVNDFHVTGSDGRKVLHQVLTISVDRVRIGMEVTVPAAGFAELRIVEGAGPDEPVWKSDEDRMEGGRFTMEVNDSGEVTSLYDTALEREWLAEPAGIWQAFDDRPNNWEAWDINDGYERKPVDLIRLFMRRVMERGPIRSILRLEFESPNGSLIEQRIILYRTLPRVDFDVRILWRDERVLLKAAFPVLVRSTHATFEMQFGAIERPTHRNTSWDDARFEVAAHRWIDLSEANGGVSLLNDCKYGFDVHGNQMRMTVLRSPAYPDPRAPHPPFHFLDEEVQFTDQGEHELRFALYPHEASWRNGTVREAHAFNSPLKILPGAAATQSLIEIDTPAVVLESLKRAENGRGFILRLYEAEGGRHRVGVRFGFQIQLAEAVDLLEKDVDNAGVDSDGNTLRFDITPFEIRSFRLVP